MSHRLLLLASALLVAGSLTAAEKVSLNIGGKPVRCDVVRMTGKEVTIRTEGKEQTLPLGVFSPKEVAACYAQIENKDAALRLGMGKYFLSKKMFTEAQDELKAAAADPATKAEAEKLMADVAAASAPPKKEPEPAKAEPAKPADKPEDKPAEPKKKPEGVVIKVPGDESSGDESPSNALDFTKQMERANVPPRSDKEMKEFLDTRKAELEKIIGGGWRMIETKHFYCFANLPEAKHQVWAQYNELFYGYIATVLQHKEGDKLWNNKCPIYYFDTYQQFQTFAIKIDNSPFGANSGGYFSARGREVHICIPFMKERGNQADDIAFSTLKHEGTHAFLQLTGEDVSLNRWLHEGLAQFIEFFPMRTDEKKSREREQRAAYLARMIRAGELPTWEAMKDRPAGGMDLVGYAFAWSKVEFLYRAPFNGRVDNQRLPKFIRLIKAGKSEDDAFKEAFGMPVDKIEQWYQQWIREAAKKNFKFE